MSLNLSKFKLLGRNNYISWLVSKRYRAQCLERENLTGRTSFTEKISNGPSLGDFIKNSSKDKNPSNVDYDISPYLDPFQINGKNRKVFFDVYGCQMNVNDTEIVWSILQSAGFSKTNDIKDAEVILMVTCAIRENAENKIWNKLSQYKSLKINNKNGNNKKNVKIGILGCMAERLKDKLIEQEKAIDLVAGPDSYKDLPRLLALTEDNQTAVNVLLSLEETYADVVPVRLNENSISAYVSIMRGCDNMCSYCIVPFTRGRERSRPSDSIVKEVEQLSQNGVKEITLLGQNVNSYRDLSGKDFNNKYFDLAPGFSTVYKKKKGGLRFSHLLERIAKIDPQMRIRFTSPHPKDFPYQVLEVIATHKNICNSIHLPAQCGSSEVLERMRRGYTREAYLDLVTSIREILPNISLSSDFICGFCGETEEQFKETLDLMKEVRYEVAYLFAYSMREKTTAHRRYLDDVPSEVKQDRLLRMVALYRKIAEELNRKLRGTRQTVLVEGRSKRSEKNFQGRTDGNIKVIFPVIPIPSYEKSLTSASINIGDYITVEINDSNSQVLKGQPLFHTSL